LNSACPITLDFEKRNEAIFGGERNVISIGVGLAVKVPIFSERIEIKNISKKWGMVS